MVIAKMLSGSTPVTVNLANFAPAATVSAWQLTASNAITRLSDLPVSGTSFTTSVPAQSVTLFVVPKSGAPVNQSPTANATATPTSGTAPLAVNFNSSGSSDPDGTIVSHAWTFGDGGSATGATTNHTYLTAGSYSSRASRTLGANVTSYSRTEAADTWVYRVQAYNGVGVSGYSNSATIRVR